MRSKPQAHEDEEEWADEAPVEALQGAVGHGAGGADEVGALLLELAAMTVRLAVLLAELDEDEFPVVEGRLAFYRSLIGQLPDSPKPRKRVGFRAPDKTQTKPRRRAARSKK